MMQAKAIALAAVAALFLGAGVAVGMVVGHGGGNDTSPSAAAQTTATPRTTANSSQLAAGSSDCMSAADIYERVRPSVVEIVSKSGGTSPFGLPQQGTGSGVVINADGTILTNNHVVDGADTLQVRFEDGTELPAHVLGTDPGNDLAVIRADLGDYKVTVAELGDSSQLRVGDAVLAIGNPFELEGTLTQGVVSGIERTFSEGQNTRPIRNMIQTDAPVNPGNSGGPLINCRAQVVGINTLLENPTGDNVNVGIAFAVAVNTAKQSLPKLLADQNVSHPWLGIAGEEVTPALVDRLNLTVDKGVYVTLAAANGPADDAGLQGAFSSEQEAASTTEVPAGGDVIVSVDGHDVATIEDLAAYLDQNKQPGDKVELKVNRDGKDMSITATLAEWPS